jgi:hypothetical protein
MKGSKRREQFLKAKAENSSMKANLQKTNFTIAENGSQERNMITEHRHECVFLPLAFWRRRPPARGAHPLQKSWCTLSLSLCRCVHTMTAGF